MPSDFLERTLEDIIFNNQEGATKRGFPPFFTNTVRQLPMPGYGVCDIFSWEITEPKFECKIFELKKDKLTIDALNQVIGYGKQISAISQGRFPEIDIQLYAIGNDIDEAVFNLGLWGINIHLYVYDYSFDGLTFEKMGKLNTRFELSNPKKLLGISEDAVDCFLIKLQNISLSNQQKNKFQP